MSVKSYFGTNYGKSEKQLSNLREYKGKSLLQFIEDYVVIDIETTGFSPFNDEIIELAAIRVENGEITDKFESLVRTDKRLNPFITELTGITSEMLSNADEISAVLPSFLKFVGESTIVAHNANFDVNFIYTNCEKTSQPRYFSNDFIDTMRLSRNIFKEYRNHRLADLITRFGFDCEVEHRALSDVKNTQKCYEYMKKYVK